MGHKYDILSFKNNAILKYYSYTDVNTVNVEYVYWLVLSMYSSNVYIYICNIYNSLIIYMYKVNMYIYIYMFMN